MEFIMIEKMIEETMNKSGVKIIKNNNNVYLFHFGPSIQAQLSDLSNIMLTIKENPDYSEKEKLRIEESTTFNYRNLATIYKKTILDC
jgi:hypothetical protein